VRHQSLQPCKRLTSSDRRTRTRSQRRSSACRHAASGMARVAAASVTLPRVLQHRSPANWPAAVADPLAASGGDAAQPLLQRGDLGRPFPAARKSPARINSRCDARVWWSNLAATGRPYRMPPRSSYATVRLPRRTVMSRHSGVAAGVRRARWRRQERGASRCRLAVAAWTS
jgi:hypothetical protein